jgi:hypothetical protein
MIGDADSWSPICQGVGCPSPANAVPALASKIPKISAVALNRDNLGIAFGSDLPRSRQVLAAPGAAQPRHTYQIHVYCATVRLSCTGRPDAGRCRRVLHCELTGLGAAIMEICLDF